MFLVSVVYNKTPVDVTWSIIQGGQLASINEHGKVSIEDGVNGQTIVIRALYNNMVAEFLTTISYDN